MSERLTRRDASKILLGSGLALAAGVGGVGGLPAALAQPRNAGRGGADKTAPPAPSASFVEGLLKKGKSHDWILKPTVHVQAYQQDTATATKDKPLVIGELSFKTAAVVFPVIRGTASSQTDIDSVKSVLTFNDRVEDVSPQYNESYHSGVRLGRWEMRDKTGREVELKLEIPMTCWETVFDEKAAAKAVWPTAQTAAPGGGGATGALNWSALARSTLDRQAMIDIDPDGGGTNARALADLLNKWTEGKSPQSVSPLMLAKTLAGKMVQNFQPSGSGEDYDQRGSFTGLILQGPADTIAKGRGSPHDLASVLLGLYRTAGLPARLVIGWDEHERKGDDSNPMARKKGGGVSLRSWVEFCLYDQPNNAEAWIPVDIVRMRKRSSQVGRIDQPWKYFGSHDELDSVLPFAHHFIPPTTVISYGYAFWGWFTTPTSQIGEHWVRFNSQTAPVRPKPRGEDPRKTGR